MMEELGTTAITAALDEKQLELTARITHRFGFQGASNPRLRALLLVEEALQFAKTVGVDIVQCHSLTDLVYQRPIGDVKRELGAIAVSALAAASSCSVKFSDVLDAELRHLQSKPPTAAYNQD